MRATLKPEATLRLGFQITIATASQLLFWTPPFGHPGDDRELPVVGDAMPGTEQLGLDAALCLRRSTSRNRPTRTTRTLQKMMKLFTGMSFRHQVGRGQGVSISSAKRSCNEEIFHFACLPAAKPHGTKPSGQCFRAAKSSRFWSQSSRVWIT